MSSIRKLIVAALIGGVLLVPSASQGGTFRVKATESRTWSPKSMTVAKRSKVVWKNPSDERHNVVSYKGPWSKSSDLPSGGRTSQTFKKAGTYKYRCSLHSKMDDGKCEGMCGSVTVR